MDGRKKAMLVAIVIVALLAAALLVVSCGGKAGTTSQTGPQLTNNAQINEFLNQLDQQMNSVNDSDMDENQLSNQSLGF